MASASTGADTSKTLLMHNALLEAKERGELVSLNAEDVLKVLDINAELLEALEAIMRSKTNPYGETPELFSEDADRARAAIAKATGQTI